MFKLPNQNGKAQGAKPSPGEQPAFPFILDIPSPLNPNQVERRVFPGVSIRDYFACEAMTLMLVDYDSATENFPAIARDSYTLADAMLKARQEEPNTSQFHEDHMKPRS